MLTLEQIADMLESAPRYGRAPERDRGPGGRFGAPAVSSDSGATEITDRHIQLSDRLAKDIAAALRDHARGESPRAVALERR